MPQGPRYAVYAVPAPGSGLAAFGNGALGYDSATGEPVPRLPDLDGLPDVAAAARVYGFHATLRAPMRLADGIDEATLRAALSQLASAHPPVAAGPLHVDALGPFLALVPVASPPALGMLAAECVAALDPLRAPLSEPERARRCPEWLDARGRALLDRWGYPYVFEAFRFHMTLTGPLPEPDRSTWRGRLAAAHGRLCGADPCLTIDALALLRQDGEAPFRVIARVPFGGGRGDGDA